MGTMSRVGLNDGCLLVPAHTCRDGCGGTGLIRCRSGLQPRPCIPLCTKALSLWRRSGCCRCCSSRSSSSSNPCSLLVVVAGCGKRSDGKHGGDGAHDGWPRVHQHKDPGTGGGLVGRPRAAQRCAQFKWCGTMGDRGRQIYRPSRCRRRACGPGKSGRLMCKGMNCMCGLNRDALHVWITQGCIARVD